MPRATARAEAARRLGRSQEGGAEAAAPHPRRRLGSRPAERGWQAADGTRSGRGAIGRGSGVPPPRAAPPRGRGRRTAPGSPSRALWGAGDCGSCPAGSRERGGGVGQRSARWERGCWRTGGGHRAPAALPFFHPGELRKAQRAEAGVTGWGAGDSLSTRALMHKGGGSWRSAQRFLITIPSVAVAHVRVPRPTSTPPQDLAAFSQLSGSQGAKGAPPRPCLTRPAF